MRNLIIFLAALQETLLQKAFRTALLALAWIGGWAIIYALNYEWFSKPVMEMTIADVTLIVIMSVMMTYAFLRRPK